MGASLDKLFLTASFSPQLHRKSRLFFKYWHQEQLVKCVEQLERAAVVIQKGEHWKRGVPQLRCQIQGKEKLFQSVLRHCTFPDDTKAGQVISPCQGPVQSECLLQMPTSSVLILNLGEPSDSMSLGKGKHVPKTAELLRASV